MVNNNFNEVDRPSHYSGSIEPLEYMISQFGVEVVISHCQCNVIKYITRFRRKDGLKDLKKARNFLDRMIVLEEQKIIAAAAMTSTTKKVEPLAQESIDE